MKQRNTAMKEFTASQLNGSDEELKNNSEFMNG